jgi:hypothetical protein
MCSNNALGSHCCYIVLQQLPLFILLQQCAPTMASVDTVAVMCSNNDHGSRCCIQDDGSSVQFGTQSPWSSSRCALGPRENACWRNARGVESPILRRLVGKIPWVSPLCAVRGGGPDPKSAKSLCSSPVGDKVV